MFNKTILLAFLFLFSELPDLSSQNPRIDGYKGLWFSSGPVLEYGYRFSGGVATFSSRYRPIAIYSPEVKKTFFVYGGTRSQDESYLLIMISYFDHRTHMVPKPVIVYDKMGVKEPHDNASLSIDSNGYLWVFISGRLRTRPGLIFKSSKPYSIDSFDKISELEMISPQPWWIQDRGFLCMFSKMHKGRELNFSLSQDGKTWTESQTLAAMGGHYQVTQIFGSKLVTVFDYHPGGNIDKRTNLYYLETEDMGKTWRTIDNKIVQIPLTSVKNEALIKDYESENKLVYLNDIECDSYGNPVILAVISRDYRPGPSGEPRELMIIHWKDQKWNFSKVCEVSGNYNKGALYITDDEWRVIGPTEPGPQKYGTGGEIALWTSHDKGFNWELQHNITSNSKFNNSFVRHPLHSDKAFYALWTDGDTEKISASSLYFTDMKCEKVWVLPYYMNKDLIRPLRIR